MRKVLLILFISLTMVGEAVCQVIPAPYLTPHRSDSTSWESAYKDHSYNKGHYALAAGVGYDYNTSTGGSNSFYAGALLPFNNMWELEGGVQMSRSNIYDVAGIMRQRLAIPVGEVFLEERFLDRIVRRSRINDMCLGFMLGYRMDYISLQAGIQHRRMMYMPRKGEPRSRMVESAGVSYRLEAFARPQTNPWNISVSISTLRPFSSERFWTPCIGLNGRFKVARTAMLTAGVCYEKAGRFHLSSEFYSISVSTSCICLF